MCLAKKRTGYLINFLNALYEHANIFREIALSLKEVIQRYLLFLSLKNHPVTSRSAVKFRHN